LIPIKDSVRPRSFPFVNTALIFLNILVFAYQLTLDPVALRELYTSLGVVPARLGLFDETLITATFLHGGWAHIIGNMLYLWVFGDNVEDRLGHTRYLFFYLLAGVAANFGHALANPLSPIPTIGASGAVAGVLGAYFLLFPRSRVLALVPLGFFLQLAEVPAVLFLFLWFVLQLLNGVANLGAPNTMAQGIAWWSHISGFAVGFLFIMLLARDALQRDRR